MAVVRCAKHKIPYNDTNPRGCPACAQEKEGGSSVMQELARASLAQRRPSGALIAPVDPDQPVTAQPRVPKPKKDWLAEVRRVLRNRRVIGIGSGVIVILLIVLIMSSGSHFTAAESPARFEGVVRPFPILPNDPISVVFAALGPQASVPNPTSRTLERYSYGTNLYVDALNGLVYAVTLAVPNRSWRGLRVGTNQLNAEGALAMLGTPKQGDPLPASVADTVSGYIVYRSLEARPRRELIAEVRPPNNCFDVVIDLQPRSIGFLTRGKQKWIVVSRVGGPQELVVTRIRVVSRSMPGAYAGEPVCDLKSRF